MAELRRNLIINGVEYNIAVNQYGEGIPTATTSGSIGVLYEDTLTGDLYKCIRGSVGAWVWEKLPSSKDVDGKFNKTGGNINGGLNISNAYENGCGTLYKNNSASADYGTVLSDTSKNGDLVELILSAINGTAVLRRNGVTVPLGADGKSAYEYAKEGGFTGTEAEFAEILAPEWVARQIVIEGEQVYGAQDLVFETGGTVFLTKFGGSFQVTIGTEYDVYWNGRRYPCTAKQYDDEPYLGNGSLVHSVANTGEPFCLYGSFMSPTTIGYVKKDSSDAETIKVKVTYRGDMEYDKMPLVYLPDEVALKSDLNTGTVLWEGSDSVTSNSSVSSLEDCAFDAEAYDYYDVTVEYGGYMLDKTDVRCYPCKITGTEWGGSAISGHLCWYAGYWLSLDVMIYDNGSARLGCLYREASSTSYMSGSQTFTITKIVGYKQ
jgi:hypothetical protein